MLSVISKLLNHHFAELWRPLEPHRFVLKLLRFANESVGAVADGAALVFVQLAAADTGLRLVRLVPGEFKGFEV